MKTFLIVAGIVATVAVIYFIVTAKTGFTCPSGSTCSRPPAVNASGFQYGNLT